ncbi:family 2 encapsulin nanocompartment cargo protein polyprenyl transferase [Saccharopolyspora mangrovi]|uniref:Family 2 encapsulin nanocompartment cargo protein polyprenyl transferase n=1 Tax=Saccharopolyspora mangrovi TaxID=3082379 RepID=A0ABU6AF07_9PSEU|nr:family 2 encapsulin nanocompartment cargo protein polyprenyl transferase [Saccharopolyspora sp. S2-29]MEB3370135.1 family 2 encapsulin nanocompartment cargo protein polyprenyl transferase [Saccharopolyspora sp. S2-29]
MTATEVTPDEEAAHAALAASRSRVDPALRAAVDTLPEDMRHIAGYHFGWWDELGRPTESSAGKALRPALVLLSAEAAGGSAEAAVPAAVAVELVHNFSLLHDDVMDNDATRRHRPTAWRVFGVSAAILAGDALLGLASSVLVESGHPAALDGTRVLNTAVQELIHGQLTDMAFEQRDHVDISQYQRMAHDKTAALLGCACGLGALFGGARPEQIEHMRAFGENLGLAFQYVDDLLGIWGDSTVTGKPVHSDLDGRKKTLPVVAALCSGTPAGAQLADLYLGQRELSTADLRTVADLIDAAGGRAETHQRANDLLTEALNDLDKARPGAKAAELTALAHLTTRRQN